jgi:hypothetical protein
MYGFKKKTLVIFFSVSSYLILDADLMNGVLCSMIPLLNKVVCCVQAPLLQTSLQVSFSINECRNTVNLNIEKMHKKIKLTNVMFGKYISYIVNQ